MIGKLLAIVALVLVVLYVASSLHLLSFASLSLPYGSASAPANLSVQNVVSALKAAFSV